ncbi:hypothetical protein F0L74_15430 [Chitinophaga agrisoli]|uniref:Nucleic acid binding protein n=2 Tax=Chitinophaga agrisoli TaxID=2607653 RepID=A0A5B2VQE8_9BACT|nr:hypothetical protein F0L74_15430 [Chitinophaga agrisoli]
MKKIIYALILLLVVVSGLVFANRAVNNETSKKPAPKLLTAAEKDAEMKKWKATPEGIKYTKWVASPAGEKVFACIAKIRKNVDDYTNMEAVVTSLSLPPGSRLGFGVMARINDEDYIVRFEPEKSQLEQLHSLKVNDKIIIRSHYISHAPKYSYPIVSGEYVERDGKVIFQRVPRKGGC